MSAIDGARPTDTKTRVPSKVMMVNAAGMPITEIATRIACLRVMPMNASSEEDQRWCSPAISVKGIRHDHEADRRHQNLFRISEDSNCGAGGDRDRTSRAVKDE